ncbi:hypothetical protein [Bradyrhizobium sp. WD16]|uniref:hypothetical protein n=1 Tax=Bradyrhizobium sp. WD16 TaxID=1521768 RepID=UPI0020A41A1A|nr:hypothetical protein [Bradyrhizobium sp. WD16]
MIADADQESLKRIVDVAIAHGAQDATTFASRHEVFASVPMSPNDRARVRQTKR